MEVPYDKEYRLPIEGLLETQADLTFVCSPNNPSGTIAPTGDLERLAAGLEGVLVIDEAYTDFAEEDDMRPGWPARKRHRAANALQGLFSAGLRLGFGVARPELLAGLVKIKDSYNVDAVALRLGAAALNDQGWMKKPCGEDQSRPRQGRDGPWSR